MINFESIDISSFKAILCDLDGTLVDSKEANYLAYRDALKELDLNLDYSEFDLHWGQDASDFLPLIFKNISIDQISAAKAIKPLYFRNYLGAINLNVPLINFLTVNSYSHKLALVTTAKIASVKQILAHHGLDQLFKVVITGDSPVAPKPSAEPYLLALKELGLNTEEVIAFEDSETGINSAVNAGIHVVKVEINLSKNRERNQ